MSNRAAAARRILAREPSVPPPAAAWLRDNRALFDAALRDASAKGRARRPAAGGLARELVQGFLAAGSPLTPDTLCAAVRDARPPLSERDIAALPGAISEELLCAAASHRPDAGALRVVCESLRALQGREVWMRRVFEAGALHQALLCDPGGVYPRMHERSQAEYRARLARLASAARIPETDAAERVLALAGAASDARARHAGYWILERPLGREPVRSAAWVHALCAVLTAAGTALFCVLCGVQGLLSLPAFAAASPVLVRRVFRRFVPSRPVPRMERCGAGALCVVTCLVGKPEKVPALCRHLEEIAISATENPNVCFGLLVDFPESSEKTTKVDPEIERALREGIDSLNASSAGRRFCFLTRERVLYPREGRFLPWERKRGALLQLVSLMSGEKSPLRVYGLTSKALRLPFLITLDEDTRPGVVSLDVLLTAAAHPLNTPVVRDGVVRAGYGILQPRLETSLASAVRTRFAGILTGGAGFDLYGDAAGEWNTDLYGTTPFTGKGLLCVQAFREVLRRPFPENAILSHDLPEGELLRTACCAGAAFDDRFPTTSAAYYARLHRWLRGDVQNLRFLFRRGFPLRGRARVLANVLRAWLPVALLAELLCACFLSPWLFLPALFLLFLDACLAAPSLFRRAHRLVRLSSPLYPGPGAEWLRAGLRLMLLPADAWTGVDATLRALFRMVFSRRGLLDWTTFADAAHKASVLCVSSLLAGVAAALSFRLPGLLLGAFWLLAPLFVWMLERETVSRETLSDSDRLRLREMAGRMLGYYLDTCTEENHWLPPDNVQEQPAAQTAHRTSPTNIGLAMLSVYAGVELGLVDRDEGLGLLEHMTDTLERIPKWNGHLPNWIDTRTLEPLRPRWISTVDSGNLAVCLWSLTLSLPLGKTRGKLGKILRETDFAALYDREQALLRLGYELERERFAPSHYDLMASEARLASYAGIAMGQLPAVHWKRLRRTVVTKNGEGGMASWSGTMFEYFLPALFLPRIRGSFLDESLCFALKMQGKAAHKGIFGMSESGFFAFDASLAYQYKAHGADALSVRADRQEPVYAPYAAYLALPWAPRAALRTLSRFDAFGMRGQYGLYEALDFDRRRTREENGMPVRSYMAHHIGMSILAVYQALTDGGAARLLSRDARFRAFAPLLAERIPYGAEGKPTEKTEERVPDSKNMERYRENLPAPDAFRPRVLTLGNAGYRVTLTDTGLARSQAGEITLCGGLEENAGGLSWTLTCGGEKMPLTYAPAYADGVSYRTVFTGDCCRWEAESSRFRTAVETRAAAGCAAEQRRVCIENRSREAVEAVLTAKLRPMLAKTADYDAHPAFSRMFLKTELEDGRERFARATVLRAKRGNAAACALCFGCDGAAKLTGMRPDRHGRANEGGGYLLDTELTARVPIRLKPGERTELRFALGFGATAQDAEQAMEAGLRLEPSGAAFRADETAAALGMDSAAVSEAFGIYADALFGTSNRGGAARFHAKNECGKDALWRVGISGDFPVLCLRVPDEKSAGELPGLFRAHVFLFTNGAFLDCAVLVSDGGDYRRPVYARAMEALRALDGENLLGVRGGVHLIDADALTAEERSGILAQSAVFIDCTKGGWNPPARLRRKLPGGEGQAAAEMPSDPVWYAFGDRTVTFTGKPAVVWSHVLANRTFGYLATDNGTGFCWHRNARENKLNEWTNDPYGETGPERIEYRAGHTRIPVFSENGDARVTYGMGFARWEKTAAGHRFSATAFVHPVLPARVMIFETDGAGVELFYRTTLLLGADRRAAATVVTKQAPDGSLLARNPGNRDFSGTIAALCMHPGAVAWSCDAQAAREERPGGEAGGGMAPGFAVRLPMEKCREGYRAVLVLGCVPNEPEVSRLHALTIPERAYQELEYTREYWNKLTDSGEFPGATAQMRQYLSGFALYQTIACRLWGRTSLWQNGGAYGFRDQLQDVLALLAAPKQEMQRGAQSDGRPAAQSDGRPAAQSDVRLDMARAQILRAAARQYAEGDVQHWWHPREKGLPRGVRTRISDDLLFLPYLLTRYAKVRRDDLADVRLPYLESPPLSPDERDRYEEAPYGKTRETVYEHCVRALELVPVRGTGPHGLLRMGGGDWNDGMDAVRGESVWLTWFAALVYREFAAFAEERGDARAARWRDYADGLTAAADRAFRGTHYLRGYYADGTPLGADSEDACRLDAIAQAFSILGGGDPARARTALKEAFSRLFDEKNQLVRLFDTPFTQESRGDPGYIKAYPPGTRENGGQYTHGAVWLAWGLYAAGLYEEGDAVMRALCPVGRDMDAYRAEPYALCGDVYASPAPAGRGGWSLYTGAASWYYTVARVYLGDTGHRKTSELI